MTRFEYSFEKVLEFEGGWTDDPVDPGGPTNFGIIIVEYAAYLGINIGTVEHPIQPYYDEVKGKLRHIPMADVETIYKKKYWDKVKADQLPVGIDQATFDWAVNSGPAVSVRKLQIAAQMPVEEQDGIMGPKTIAAVTAADPRALLRSYMILRRKFYRSLANFWRFGKGWLARCDTLEDQAIAAIETGTKTA